MDWRGWIGLAWVLVWGTAYAATAIQARAPHVIAWLRSSPIGRSPVGEWLGWLLAVSRS